MDRRVPHQRKAEAALTEVVERRWAGTWGDPGKQTVEGYLTTWLVLTRPSLRPTTAASYEATPTSWTIPCIGSVRLPALTPARLGLLYDDLLSAGRRDGRGGLSPWSVRYAHSILSHMLKDAVWWGLLPRNPALVDALRQRALEMQVWTDEQVREFLALIADDRLYPMWSLLALTRLRRGEVLGLKWPDLDLERGALTVRRALVDVAYVVYASEPKTARGFRLIGIDPLTSAALEAWRERQSDDRRAAAEVWGDTGFAFTDELGRPLHLQRVSVLLCNVLRDSAASPHSSARPAAHRRDARAHRWDSSEGGALFTSHHPRR